MKKIKVTKEDKIKIIKDKITTENVVDPLKLAELLYDLTEENVPKAKYVMNEPNGCICKEGHTINFRCPVHFTLTK
jgi:hypothetical protein